MTTRKCSGFIPCISLIAAAVLPGSLFADEFDDEVASKRIKHLIGMLASRNAPPRIVGDGKMKADITFEKTYDRNLQGPVFLAMQQLLAEDEAALDQLWKPDEGNKRYCLSVTIFDLDYNETVGGICGRIIRAKLYPFEAELHFMTRGQGVDLIGEKPARKWWESRKKLGLAKVQIEAIDRMIKFVEKLDYKDASPEHPAAEKMSRKKFERRRKANTRILKAMRETIIRTGQPYRPKTCFDTHEHILGLPWDDRVWHK
jgi:hypothetical protein